MTRPVGTLDGTTDLLHEIAAEPNGTTPSPTVERVSEADHQLLLRMLAKITPLQSEIDLLRGVVMGHLSAVYSLSSQDGVRNDGVIVRGAPQS